MAAGELLDTVDRFDTITGTIEFDEYYGLSQSERPFIRSAALFIRNSKGELWVPRRAAHKIVAPLGLDYSAAGHVSAGETYEQAVIREAAEELNLLLSPGQLKLVGITPPGESDPYFVGLYEYLSDVAPGYSHDEFCEDYWLLPTTMHKMLTDGEPAKLSLIRSVELILKAEA